VTPKALAHGCDDQHFLLNNELTYRDRRLRGMGLLRGWVTFALACSVGAIANVGGSSAIRTAPCKRGWRRTATKSVTPSCSRNWSSFLST
jgi:hypothetical protein